MKRNRWRETSFEKWIEDKGDSASQFLSNPRDSIVFRLNSPRNTIQKIGDEPSFSIDFSSEKKKNCFFGYFNFNGKTLKALKLRSGLCKFGITFSQEITYILRHLYIYFYPETTYEQLISFQLFIYEIININKMLIFMSRSLYLYHLYLIRI